LDKVISRKSAIIIYEILNFLFFFVFNKHPIHNVKLTVQHPFLIKECKIYILKQDFIVYINW